MIWIKHTLEQLLRTFKVLVCQSTPSLLKVRWWWCWWWVACEIILSSPGTGGRGTLYFPFPVSNGLAAARRRRRRRARWRTWTITSASFPTAGQWSSLWPTRQDRRSSISTRPTSSGNKTTYSQLLVPEIGCTLCRKELKGAIESKVWIHIGVTHYKTKVILQMKGIISGWK